MSSSRSDSLLQASKRPGDGASDGIALPFPEQGQPATCAEFPTSIRGEHELTAAPVFIANVSFDSYCLYVRLAPAQEIAIPLHRLPSLAAAPPAHRRSWQIVEHGTAVIWPELHLTITLAGLQQARHDPTRLCEQLTLLEAVR